MELDSLTDYTAIQQARKEGLAAIEQAYTAAAGKLKKLLESSRAENGWDGITVATLAMNSPVGVLLSAFLFGMLRSASISMSLTSQVTTEMISVLQGFIVMLVASPDVWNVLGRLCQRIGIRRKQEGAAE